ncbi:helicase SNF2, partial [Acidimicrobiaceae bacterium USS-CC1]|nr:helicase SNF2 [Acidiferrimicrobium australe]
NLTLLRGGAAGGKGAAARRTPTAPVPPPWEEPLRSLLADTGRTLPSRGPAAPAADAEEPLALQLEVVASRRLPGRKGAEDTGPGIRMRPVLRNPSGNWVRTGVSWSRLDYLGYGRSLSEPMRAGLTLLRELRALHALGSTYSYDEAVWLESIQSRRLWDLLHQAGEIGVPIVQSGRDAGPVEVSTARVEAALDLRRDGPGLLAQPQLVAGEVEVSGTRLWIGAPAHGIAWWEGPGPGKPGSKPAAAVSRGAVLRLAALERAIPPDVATLLTHPPIEVPAADVERFEREVCPRIRRRVRLRSSDRTVELPEELPDTLVLGLEADGVASLALTWSVQGPDGQARTTGDAPDEVAAGAIATAAYALGTNPELSGLVVGTHRGLELLPEAHLEQMAAVRFVTEVLPDLEEIDGLRVEWRGEPAEYREVHDAPVVSFAGEEGPSGDWFDLQVEVEVGGEKVPFEELFRALAGEETHLLLPSGRYFSLDRPELRQLAELIAEARSLQDAPRDGIRLGRFQASLWEELLALGTVAAQAGAWADAVAALASAGDDEDRPLPAGLDATLRPYQETGFQWLASRYEHRLGGILADDMGLGKTLQALALVCHAREEFGAEHPFLVVAPTSVVGNWVTEAARFAPGLPCVAITETQRRRGTALADAVAGAALVVTSYTLFRLEFDDYDALGWSGLLLDEAQFAKNPASHNYQRARRLAAPFKLAMTGTPLENSLTELWALTSITAPGLFSRPDRFAETYRVPIERHHDEERLDQLRRRIKPVMLRRTKEQVAADLPDKQEQVLELDLHPRHRKLYQTWLARERQKILGLLGDIDGNRFEIFRSLTLLRQAALDVSLVDASHAGVPATKLDALDEMLTDVVADGHRVLVFSQFTRFLTAARRRVEAAGIDYCYLDGKTTRRAEVIRRFREGSAPVFLISLKAGGFGLNLTEADYCVLLDPWWNPATEAQAVDRAHRIGQTRKVMVYRMVAKDTIEEKVMALKARKAALFDSVVGGGGFESGALTADDVRALLA